MHKIKIYIAGPITGLPNLNKEAFAKMENDLTKLAVIEALNPHKLVTNLGPNASWEQYMRICIQAVATAQALILLPGWQHSKGATFERMVAQRLHIPVVDSIDDALHAVDHYLINYDMHAMIQAAR